MQDLWGHRKVHGTQEAFIFEIPLKTYYLVQLLIFEGINFSVNFFFHTFNNNRKANSGYSSLK